MSFVKYDCKLEVFTRCWLGEFFDELEICERGVGGYSFSVKIYAYFVLNSKSAYTISENLKQTNK